MIKTIGKKIVVKILTLQAKIILWKFKPRIIAITGNVGKTSTKEATALMLEEMGYHLRKSQKSYNSEFGVPLTILGIDTAWDSFLGWFKNIFVGFISTWFSTKYPEWLVLEVGADRPGDISSIAKWIKSDVVVITRVPDVPVHIEFFDSKEQVIKEKLSLINSLKPTGVLVVNGDDDNLKKNLKSTRANQIISYGFSDKLNLQASNDHLMYKDDTPIGMAFKVDHDGSSFPVRLNNALGRQHISVVLAALSVGVALKENMINLIEAIDKYTPPPGRLRIIPGLKNSIILDDTYNASPLSVEEGLRVLSQIKNSGRKIAVLGDMLELGKYTPDSHFKIGEIVGDKCDLLLAVGLSAKFYLEGARQAKMKEENIFHFDFSIEAGKKLQNILQAGDVVFVKGSQSIRMEKVVEEVMVEPEKKQELLCRQDIEWGRR